MSGFDVSLPIGVFDSGVGGLTVYRALHERLPNERFVYLGDTARVPYGTKSLATIERYGVENAKFLASQNIKLLVIACNTASALAIPAIRKAVAPIEVIGVIEPGAKSAFETKAGKIGVIATEATIHSRAYSRAIHEFNPKVEVIETACPLFVPLAEESWANEPETRSIAAKYLRELVENNIETLVLGCTHYPILRDVIQSTIGANVILIDSGQATAFEVENILKLKNLANTPSQKTSNRRLCDDLDHFFVTDAAERFARVAERFLGSQPTRLEAVELWGNDELRTN
ncbi:MAG: glutamate racemase [Pyrinomonadaceae bacterium]|nr:glutamate racemase [Pyrinomonadaceae bacterium]